MNYGAILARNGEFDEALKLHMTALSIRQSTAAKEHPDLATAFGTVLQNQGDGALQEFQKALTKQKDVLGKCIETFHSLFVMKVTYLDS